MIVSIIKGIVIAVAVAFCFALVALAVLFAIAYIATAKWQSENGDQYYNDEEDEL